MAAENSQVSGITDGNRIDLFQVPDHTPLPEGAQWLRASRADHEDLHAEVHEILRIQREMYEVLVRFRPLLDQFATSPLATRRAVRKAARG